MPSIPSAWPGRRRLAKKSGLFPTPRVRPLAKQIEHGAPADIFISADLDWMKYLSDKKLIKPGTEVKLLGNSLVLGCTQIF